MMMKLKDGLKFAALTLVFRICNGVAAAVSEVGAIAGVARNQLGDQIDADYQGEHPEETRALFGKPNGKAN